MGGGGRGEVGCGRTTGRQTASPGGHMRAGRGRASGGRHGGAEYLTLSRRVGVCDSGPPITVVWLGEGAA